MDRRYIRIQVLYSPVVKMLMDRRDIRISGSIFSSSQDVYRRDIRVQVLYSPVIKHAQCRGLGEKGKGEEKGGFKIMN